MQEAVVFTIRKGGTYYSISTINSKYRKYNTTWIMNDVELFERMKVITAKINNEDGEGVLFEVK